MKLGRRLFLGGAGAAIALPFLPSAARWMGGGSVARAGGAACEVPKRFVAWYLPCGVHMPAWRPTATGTDFTLPRILEPLAPVREHLLVLSGIANRPGESDGPGDHASGTGAFLSATHVFKTDGADIRNGISIDQVAAMHIGSCTRFPSLELGIDGGGNAGGCDSGYSCAYSRNISWSGPSTPMPKITDARVVFDRLFAGYDPSATRAEIERRQAYQTSVLDHAIEDASQLRGRLGTDDRRKLDEYLTAVREVELRVASTEIAVCEVPDRPADGLDVTAKTDAMSDLTALALQCDLTRVVTFMLGNAGSNRSYAHLGIGEGHHQLSHHDGDAATHAKLVTIARWEMERFAYFLGRLATITEPDGTPLIDSSAVYLSSEISDGDRHNHDDLPVLLAGSAGGAWETGRHLSFDGAPPMGDLFVRILQGVGVPVSEFGDDGTEPLAI